MSIREKKNKDGTISFYITVFEGYKIDRRGQYVQNRKYKSFKQPKGMGIRKARQIAKEMELEFQNQFQMKQSTGIDKKLSEVWSWYKKYYAPNKLRESTIYSLDSLVQNKILPELGNYRIGDISTSRITIFLNDVAIVRDRKTGKPLRPKQYYKDSYVQTVFSALNRLFEFSISQGWIKENPCNHAIKPSINKSIKKRPLEINQIKDIIKKTNDFSVHNAVIQFQIYTGMRIGETLALTWDDIDFKNKEININKTINFVGKDPIIGPPKTNNSYRILGMSNTVFNILKMVQQEQNERKQFLKEQYINPDIVFSTPLGDYIHRNNINNRLNAIKEETDYEYITVHFLRHANATLLLMNDVDIKVVSAHLGHNDIQTTANIYADVLKSKEHQIAQLIEFNLEDDQ